MSDTARVQFRLSQAEWDGVASEAEQHGLSVSRYAKMILLNGRNRHVHEVQSLMAVADYLKAHPDGKPTDVLTFIKGQFRAG